MLSKLFSLSQLKEYRNTCLFLRHAAKSGQKVNIFFRRTDTETWQGKLIYSQNEFFIRKKRGDRMLVSININYIEQAQIVDGFLNIEYSGSY